MAPLDTAGLGAQLALDSLPPLSSDVSFQQITSKNSMAAPTKFPLRIPNGVQYRFSFR